MKMVLLNVTVYLNLNGEGGEEKGLVIVGWVKTFVVKYPFQDPDLGPVLNRKKKWNHS